MTGGSRRAAFPMTGGLTVSQSRVNSRFRHCEAAGRGNLPCLTMINEIATLRSR
jgi:hypothetical protein